MFLVRHAAKIHADVPLAAARARELEAHVVISRERYHIRDYQNRKPLDTPDPCPKENSCALNCLMAWRSHSWNRSSCSFSVAQANWTSLPRCASRFGHPQSWRNHLSGKLPMCCLQRGAARQSIRALQLGRPEATASRRMGLGGLAYHPTWSESYPSEQSVRREIAGKCWIKRVTRGAYNKRLIGFQCRLSRLFSGTRPTKMLRSSPALAQVR